MDESKSSFTFDKLSKKNLFISGKNMLQNFLNLPIDQHLRVLDLGCGTGDLTVWIANKYPKARFDAIDPSTDRIEFARKNNSSPRISYFVDDAISFLHVLQHRS